MVSKSDGEWCVVPAVCSSKNFSTETKVTWGDTTVSFHYYLFFNIGLVCLGPNTTLFIDKSSLFQSSLLHNIILSSGLSDPGNHLSAGKHPGHYSYNKEQEPPLTYVLLRLQVNSSHNNPPLPLCLPDCRVNNVLRAPFFSLSLCNTSNAGWFQWLGIQGKN